MCGFGDIITTVDSARPSPRGLAAVFAQPGVADAYQHRPPYPPDVFDVLEQLITDRPRNVLDIGAGEGALARQLAARVDHLDAMDVSAAMVAAGRRRPGGRQSNLHWIIGAVETGELGGPYALVTAGASLHWMAWEQTMARLAGVMTDNAFLAVVDHSPQEVPWRKELVEVIVHHSRNPDFDPRFSVVDALCDEGLFELTGRAKSAPMSFRQSVASYVEQFHSTATLARELMSNEEATAFDLAIKEIVRPWTVDDVLEMKIVATVAWGHPAARSGE